MAVERSVAWTDGLVKVIVPFLLGLLMQAVWYNVAVRDDLHDLKRDMAEVRCTVAVFTKAPQLPPNCYPGRYGGP